MTKGLLIVALLVATIGQAIAQNAEEFKPYGRMEGRIYTDFSADVVGDGDEKAFELKRAYFGYRYQITPEWRAHVRVDVGGSEFVIEDVLAQYVFFKTAALYYEKDHWFAAFGLHDTYQFKVQEGLWGKRYILPSMLDRQKFDFSADIGASAQYRTDNFSVDVALFNGEGYKQLQQDDAFRGSVGLTGWFLDKKLIGRIYVDQSSADVHLSSYTGFVGLDLDKFTFGAEYTHQNNYTYVDGHNRDAYSFFTQYNITPRIGLWARIDGMVSEFDFKEPLTDDNINYIASWRRKDGEDIFAGVEYVVVPKRINTSLNYQHHRSDEASPVNSGKIFFNVEVRF
ncbi:hypothetical protein [Carboxylicivirga taeanensis]|uniref:hypothetical protein n=1 Tax=Carboxylicivirga taeanensis TaxID=1416875 RepID=UPI003F6E1756